MNMIYSENVDRIIVFVNYYNSRPKVFMDILQQSAQVPELKARRVTHLLYFMYKNKTNNKLLNNKSVRTRMLSLQPQNLHVKNTKWTCTIMVLPFGIIYQYIYIKLRRTVILRTIKKYGH